MVYVEAQNGNGFSNFRFMGYRNRRDTMPESEEDGTRITEWKKRVRKAQAEISLHLSDSQLPLVIRFKTSKDMRDAL